MVIILKKINLSDSDYNTIKDLFKNSEDYIIEKFRENINEIFSCDFLINKLEQQ